MTARRGIAEPEAAGVGKDRRVQRLRNLGRDIEAPLAGEIVDQLAGGACGDVRQNNAARGIVGRDMMVDHQFGHGQCANGIREAPQPLHVTDVKHDKKVDVF